MTIKFRISFGDIYEALEDGQKDILWDSVGSKIYGKVKRLMNKGKNTDNQPYQDYDKKYKAWKVEEGRYAGRVNLQLTGDMQKAISFEGNKDGFTIFINGDKENKKAIYLNGSKNWTFFQWGKELDKILDKALEKALEDLGL